MVARAYKLAIREEVVGRQSLCRRDHHRLAACGPPIGSELRNRARGRAAVRLRSGEDVGRHNGFIYVEVHQLAVSDGPGVMDQRLAPGNCDAPSLTYEAAEATERPGDIRISAT